MKKYKSKFKEGDFVPNEKYADNYTIKSIMDFIKKNQSTEYPIQIQLSGDKGKTKNLSLSLKDVWQIVYALQKKY